jgi:hypothetical protein
MQLFLIVVFDSYIFLLGIILHTQTFKHAHALYCGRSRDWRLKDNTVKFWNKYKKKYDPPTHQVEDLNLNPNEQSPLREKPTQLSCAQLVSSDSYIQIWSKCLHLVNLVSVNLIRLSPKAELGLDLAPWSGAPNPTWLVGQHRTALYIELGADGSRHEVHPLPLFPPTFPNPI